jgi:hypothetical protein
MVPTAEEMVRLTRQHWSKHRPRLYAGLKETGRLEEMIRAAVSQTVEAMDLMVSRGADPLQAWQALREEWILVPQEEPDHSNPEAPCWPA